MKILYVAMAACALFLFSCNKGADASDIAATYAGSYVLTDTTTYVDPGSAQTITQYNTSNATLTETAHTTLSLTSFPRLACAAATASVTTTALSLVNVTCTAGPHNFVCTLSGTTLYYSYDWSTFHVRGIAVKQ